MSSMRNLPELMVYFVPWLLLAHLCLAFIWLLARRRRAGKFAAVVSSLSLIALLAVLAFGDIAWYLLPVLVRGHYQYVPGETEPDERLVKRRPELMIERQLAALLSQTGPPPLRAESPLTAFRIETVKIERWRQSELTAVIEATLNFADGSEDRVSLVMQTKGGAYVYFPFAGAVSLGAFAWHAPGSTLSFLMQPAPVTGLRTHPAPVNLLPIATLDVPILPGVNPAVSRAVVSDLESDGRILFDLDLRLGQPDAGNALLLRASNGQVYQLTETWLSARAAFSPDGEHVAYVLFQQGGPHRLIIGQADGSQREITTVDWATHHWVGNDQLAYSYNETAYLYNLADGTSQPLAVLVPRWFEGYRYFRVSPDGHRIAYVDFDGRLWVQTTSRSDEELQSDGVRHLGWDVSDLGNGSGLAWRPDGQKLVYTTRNVVTRPGQSEVWLWDSATGRVILLARAGKGFLGSESGNVLLGGACWVGTDTVLFVAQVIDIPNRLAILLSDVDGSSLWDVTPSGVTITSPDDLHCANGRVAINTSPTTIVLYEAVSTDETDILLEGQ
jgi:hypothetical protein